MHRRSWTPDADPYFFADTTILLARIIALLLIASPLAIYNSALAEDPAPATPSPTSAPAEPLTTADPATLPEFNRIVLDLIAKYPTDGTHDYWWPRAGESSYDGVSRDVMLAGEKVMSGEPEQRTFCCGLTLEVFVDAYEQYIAKHGVRADAALKPADFPEFQRLWFVEKVNGPGPSAALEKFHLGRTITKDEVLPGDFVQIWRRWDPEKAKNGSGHSVVFLNWVKDDAGKVTGIRYFSTQPNTKGINVNVEYIGEPTATKGVAMEFTHFARVDVPKPTT